MRPETKPKDVWDRPELWTNAHRWIEHEAERMAVHVNGGNWNRDYTEAQKMGWRRKIEYMLTRVKEW